MNGTNFGEQTSPGGYPPGRRLAKAAVVWPRTALMWPALRYLPM